MAEIANGKSLVDVDSLKETLYAQQRLLQKLYNELDAEREASSTAASEALSVILRLQGEKAAVKMEADQYRRIVEEKMCHAEESLAIFEDIMYQKEMELASLDYQVQAYRLKLISMGYVDPGNGEIKFPENLLQRCESKTGEVPVPSLARRNSAPMLLPPKYPHTKRGSHEKERSLSPDRDLLSKDADDCTSHYFSDSNSDSGKKTDCSGVGDINSYWEEIRKLDGRVKEIAGVSYANWRSSSRSSSPISQYSGNSYDPAKGATLNEMDQAKLPGKMVDAERTGECSCSPGVLDVFEVPQAEKSYEAPNLHTRNQENITFHDEDKLQKPDSISEEIVKASTKDGTDWLKRILKSSNGESNLIGPSEAVVVDCNMATIRTTTNFSECPSRLHQVNKTSEIVEIDRQDVRQEPADRQEELKLLKEIREQLNSIQQDLRRLRPKKPSRRDDRAFFTLMEEMLHFWL